MQVMAIPILHSMYNNAQDWFLHCLENHLSPLSTALIDTPYDQSGLTGVLSDVVTRI